MTRQVKRQNTIRTLRAPTGFRSRGAADKKSRWQMGQPLRVLIVEDSERDAALLVRELRRGGYAVTHDRVETQAAMTAALRTGAWDIVLSDCSIPHFSAQAALAVLAEAALDLPCIVVSGSVGEEAAVELMRAGAQDLVLKDNLKRLLPAIARELGAALTRRERRAADAKLDRERQLLRQLMEGIPDASASRTRTAATSASTMRNARCSTSITRPR